MKRIFISADHGMAIIYFLQSDSSRLCLAMCDGKKIYQVWSRNTHLTGWMWDQNDGIL